MFDPRQRDLEILAEIGRSLLEATLDVDDLCELIYQLAGHVVPTNSFQLGLFEGDSYHVKIWVKDGVRQRPSSFVIPEGKGIIGWMRTARQPLLVRDFQAEMFVTAFYSTLDIENHLLTYASAGHNLAIHVPGANHTTAPLITDGIPLGILAPIQIEQKTLSILRGDVVLFYTDGVTEVVNAGGEEFGEGRLAEVLCLHRAESPEVIADAIEDAVRDFTGDLVQSDDFTLVLVKRDD